MAGATVPPQAWRTVGACTYGLVFGPNVLTIRNFAVFINPLQQEFGWGIPAISLGASLISLMIVFISPLQGLAVDRFGSRRTVLTSIPFFGAALASLYFLPATLLVFYAAWVVICLAGFGVWATAYLRATAEWFNARLGLALGVANSGIGFSRSHYGSYAPVMWTLAGVAIACAVLFTFLGPYCYGVDDENSQATSIAAESAA